MLFVSLAACAVIPVHNYSCRIHLQLFFSDYDSQSLSSYSGSTSLTVLPVESSGKANFSSFSPLLEIYLLLLLDLVDFVADCRIICDVSAFDCIVLDYGDDDFRVSEFSGDYDCSALNDYLICAYPVFVNLVGEFSNDCCPVFLLDIDCIQDALCPGDRTALRGYLVTEEGETDRLLGEEKLPSVLVRICCGV